VVFALQHEIKRRERKGEKKRGWRKDRREMGG